MKRVVGSAVLSLLVLTGPAFLERAGVVGVANVAFAQPTDAVTEVARQRYKEGVKAYEAGKFEDARAAFLQAYALKRVPAVLLNLGQSELRTSPPHYEDAGNHLQQFLREHTAATPDEKAAAEKGIADVKKKSAQVSVIVDAPGADIAIDGTVVGKSPLADPVFVKPGKHAVAASGGGKSANDAFDAQIGATKSVTLALAGAAPPIAPVSPPVGPAPPLSPPLAPTTPPPEVPPMNNGPVMPPPSGEVEGQTFFQWYSKRPVAWVTTGVAGVGFLGGLIFSIAAAAASGTTNSAGDSNPHAPRHAPDAHGSAALRDQIPRSAPTRLATRRRVRRCGTTSRRTTPTSRSRRPAGCSSASAASRP